MPFRLLATVAEEDTAEGSALGRCMDGSDGMLLLAGTDCGVGRGGSGGGVLGAVASICAVSVASGTESRHLRSAACNLLREAAGDRDANRAPAPQTTSSSFTHISPGKALELLGRPFLM